MKNLLSIAAAIIAMVLPVKADDAAVLSKIEKANASVSSVEARFTHENTKNGKTSRYEGTYYYSAGSLAMVYTVDSEALVIGGGKLYLKHGGKVTKGDTTRNDRMRSLSSTLIDCIKGNIRTVAENNKADYTVTEDSSSYTVVIKARKKASKGYSSITLKYRKSDCLLTALTLEEFNGTVNKYTLTSPKSGVSIPADTFSIPSK